ncbi:rod shape-determining protein MreC [bacterium]|nr:rod shape-determining protein MreC [bacterium]MBU1072544.1 rod shape-determining protein MreC [bacterium]MBU1675003.1 rod shape-determining protein MreC [bacterium]
MASKPAYRSNRVENLALVVCLIVSTALLAQPEKQRIHMADFLGTILTSPYHRTVDFGRDIARVRRENDVLRAEIAALRLQQQSAVRFRRDRDELRRALGLVDVASATLVPCEVERRRVSSFASMVRVSAADTVAWERYQPVITTDGLVGRIHTVTGPRTAWVELLTSPGMAVSCELERSGLPGILHSRGGDFDLALIGRDEDVRVGDRVVSSDIAMIYGEGDRLSGGLPRGLPVGVVSEVSSPPEQLFKSVRVEPASSFTSLDVVFVIVGSGEWFVTQTPAPLDARTDDEEAP